MFEISNYWSFLLKGIILLAINNQMSANSEQNEVSYSNVKVAGRPKYQIQKLHFAMNNPVLRKQHLQEIIF